MSSEFQNFMAVFSNIYFRQTFDRILANHFPLKKLKTVFQKYIDFETKFGEKANISKIKKMASSMLNDDNYQQE